MTMKGNTAIAEILTKRGINTALFENLKYEVTKFGDIERTKIEVEHGFPIYCLCDGYYMSWYGDYGSFGFDCTWRTSIENLPYQSPHYMYEKMDLLSKGSGNFKEFDSNKCRKELLETIMDSDSFQELDELDQEKVIKYIQCPYCDIDESLKYEEDELDELKTCYMAAGEDEYSWVNAVREVSDSNTFISCESYAMYDFGMQLPTYFFIVFYVLSIVNDMIQEEKKNKMISEAFEHLEDNK